MPSLTASRPCVGASFEKIASVLDPVSMSTVNVWRGEPTDTLTKYSVRILLIETGTSMPCLLCSSSSGSTISTCPRCRLIIGIFKRSTVPGSTGWYRGLRGAIPINGLFGFERSNSTTKDWKTTSPRRIPAYEGGVG
eukprot:04555_6